MKRLFFLLISVFLLSPASSLAQEFSVGVYPPIIQIEAFPPANIRSPITLQNLSDERTVLKIELRRFKAQPEIEYYKPNERAPGNAQFLSFVEILEDNKKVSEIALSPKQKKNLILHIGIPKNEKISDYYFSIMFLSKNESGSDQNKSLAVGGIATNVLLSLGPGGKPEGEIAEFGSPSFVQKGPVEFSVKVRNQSPHFITADGTIVIKNLFGQPVGEVRLNPTNVLAGSVRKMLGENQEGLAWKDGFLLGPYTAELAVTLSDQGPILRKNHTFLAFPLELAVGAILAVLILLFIARRAMKMSRNQ